MAAIEITTDNFEDEILDSQIPVIMDFWSYRCGPCMRQLNVMTELADDWDNEIKIAKINVDEEEDIADYFDIKSIPTLFFINDGMIVNRETGYRTKDEIEDIVRDVFREELYESEQ